ncbi:MAG: hypothetical protein ACXACU_18980 [Candidatus Hodarchaeales archaeon]
MTSIVSGIDEAGRGSVFGPLVVVGVTLDQKSLDFFVKKGLKDSKLFSGFSNEEKRSKIALEIQKKAIDLKIIEIKPEEIDRTLNNRPSDNLNLLEIRYFSEIILQLSSSNITIDTLSTPKYTQKYLSFYLDKLDNELRFIFGKVYAEHSCFRIISNNNLEKEIRVAQKADRDYPIVSAASCVAKHIRDQRLREIERDFELPSNCLGKGYPNEKDHHVMHFLEEYKKEIQNQSFPFIRYSWSWPDHLFRQYDIRGKFPEHLTLDLVLNFGRILGKRFGKEKTIAVGGDVRLSTPLIKNILSAGLMESGCHILDVGVCTTPTIYFLAAENLEINGGVMITASHNPIEYNGIKVCDENGVSFHYENLFSELKKNLEQNEFVTIKSREYGQPASFPQIGNDQYWHYQKKNFNPNKSLEVIIDIGNGTCYPIINLLKSSKIEVLALHPDPDGHFPVMIPDPAKSSCLRFIQERMKEQKVDVGIGFDADGDRVGFIDDLGEIISPDQIIMIYGEHLLQEKSQGEIMIDIKTSRATYEYLTNLGANVKFTRVGHSWIHESLLKSGAIFAGELSGHYYFGLNYYGFDDAIYSALRLLEILSSKDQTLSHLIQKLPRYFTSDELRISCPDQFKDRVVSNIKEKLARETEKIITIDGIRAEFHDGWVLVRKSGTEPVISVRAEAMKSPRLEYYQINIGFLT